MPHPSLAKGQSVIGHRQFLDTIRDDPESDAPLVYADWLEENGECDRAELIRVSCRLYMAVEDFLPGQWMKLVRRKNELITAVATRDINQGDDSIFVDKWHRGLITEVACNWSDCSNLGEPASIDHLLERHPLRWIHLRTMPAWERRTVVPTNGLKKIDGLWTGKTGKARNEYRLFGRLNWHAVPAGASIIDHLLAAEWPIRGLKWEVPAPMGHREAGSIQAGHAALLPARAFSTEG